MKTTITLATLILIAASASAADKPAPPFANPYLSASHYSVTHGWSDYSPVAGPMAKSRHLRDDEKIWQPVGPINGFPPTYSGPYPNGKHVIWVGGYDRVSKLDADTMQPLTTYAIGGNTYFGNEEIRHDIAIMDKVDDKGLVDFDLKLLEEAWPSTTSAYKFLSRESELYMPYRAPDGSVIMRVYGEEDHNNPASKIHLMRQWALPAEISKARIFGMQMSSSGEIVMATMDGRLIAVARDFSSYDVLTLPSSKLERPVTDTFSSFVRNGLSSDDRDGIFVVTRDYMHRAQWTGKKLSLDEADGGWSTPYPNENGLGSGTTPGLMGWGSNEDHLVVIGDGSDGNHMIAFWRDAIPADWKGIEGHDRRIAGDVPIHFGVSKDEQVRLENAPVVYGYGAFFNNTYPVKHLPKQGGPTIQWMAESLYFHVPGHEARGGTMIRWEPKTRTLVTAWETQENLLSTVCTVSGPNEMLYCGGARNREWTVERIDWNTGKTLATYTLGKSHRYNPLGGPLVIAPNGAVDCGCLGGLGMVRVMPTPDKKSKH